MADINAPVSNVAERYAAALFDLAEDDKGLAELEADVGSFATLHDQSDDLQAFLRSPVYGAEEQARALEAILEKGGIKGLTGNFFKVLAANRRLFIVPEVLVAFRRLLAKKRGEVTAEVVSAEPLTEAQVADLKAALKASLGKEVSLEASVDPALIGGLTVKVGSRMIDGSLRTKLNSLKLAMKEVG